MDLDTLPDRPLRETEFQQLAQTDSLEVVMGTTQYDTDGEVRVYEFFFIADEWVSAFLHHKKRGTWVSSGKTPFPDDYDDSHPKAEWNFVGTVAHELYDETGVDLDDDEYL